MEGSSSGLI